MALAGLSGSIISQTYSINDIAIIVLEYSKLLTESEDGYVSEINRETGENVILSPADSMEGGYLPVVKGAPAATHPTRDFGDTPSIRSRPSSPTLHGNTRHGLIPPAMSKSDGSSPFPSY